MSFLSFKLAIAHQFDIISRHPLFYTAVDNDVLWQGYLSSFPEGTNPIFRKRTEHDCGCCRQFIRTIGAAVAVIDHKLVSIWDAPIDDPTYRAVGRAMSELVTSKPIANIFLHPEATVGTDKSRENSPDMVTTWDHFFVHLPRSNSREQGLICPKSLIGPRQAQATGDHDVLLRGLREITPEALDTVLALIERNELYRGFENRFAVQSFSELKQTFDRLPEEQRDAFVWAATTATPAVTRFRNTSIGDLLVDLSSGVDLDAAVRAFDVKVAPQNYRRSTSLVTASMIAAAKATIEELGFTSALDRRYARLSDITINNVLFANRDTRKALTGDVFDQIPTKPLAVKDADKIAAIPIERFLSEIVPQVQSIDVMFDPEHTNNLVSLIAPSDPTAKTMFKWDNRFSWSYVGDMADSIKERVKKAGGSVSGDLCCRLAWHNFDDLDLHMIEPGYELFYANRGNVSPSGGRLDVDMNVSPTTREPVENIFYASLRTMREGRYHLFVQQFSKRETTNVGFEVEIDLLGTQYNFVYNKAATGNVSVVKFDYSKSTGITFLEALAPSRSSKQLWNIQTGNFHPVSAIMMSPNYWDEQQGSGNKHYFFMIDGCRNDGSARGFFNEHLTDDLMRHRKVLEVVANQLKVPPSDSQLSGLGFSSTRRTEFLVRVSGKINRILKIVI